MTSVYQELAIDSLQRGRYQPRLYFDQQALQELADSILAQGLIEPLIVRHIACQRYEIIAGERRWRAALLAGLATVPCLIGDYTDEQAATLTLVENIQREELNLIEEAQGYQRLSKEFHFQQAEIAALVSKSRSHIANLLRLLSLSELVQQAIIAGELSLGHARLLVGLPTALQLSFVSQIKEQEWSVRVFEEKIKALKYRTVNSNATPKNTDIQRLEISLAEQMGAPVQIISEKGSAGWLQVKFFDNDTLTGLLERMGLRYD